MAKRMIAIVPQIESMDVIEALRRRFDPLAGKIPPHIALVHPFDDPISADDLRAHVEEAVKGIAPFQLRLQGITGHEGEYLFLNVKRGNDQIIELHDRLYTGPLARYRSLLQTFLPHLTLGKVYQSSILRDAVVDASTRTEAYETTINEVTVYTTGIDGSRVAEKTVPLG